MCTTLIDAVHLRDMLVTKADGTVEEFKPSKLRNSLKNSGAPKAEIEEIVTQIEAIAHDGIKTQDIYRHAFSLLRGAEASLARLYKRQGYDTRTGITMKGKCATHEIDLAAYKADHAFIAEAKFHARPGLKSDLQVAMYSYARLLDLSDQKICNADVCGVKNLKLITNTKFTHAATKYADCVGVELLSWDFPKKGNLYEMIDEYKLYPITVLQSLSVSQKQQLLAQNIVLCEDLVSNPSILNQLNLSASKMEALIFEARQLSPVS